MGSKEEEIIVLRKENAELRTRVEELERKNKWRSFLTAYPTKERRALEFQTQEGIRRAIELCFEQSEFSGMPFDFADGLTMVVPEEAVELFRLQGLKFEATELISMSDLSPEEAAELRRKHGM